jgi:hypothetical protein
MIPYKVSICDKAGWQEFVVALTPELERMVRGGGNLITQLRRRLGDIRFSGHAMIIEPC